VVKVGQKNCQNSSKKRGGTKLRGGKAGKERWGSKRNRVKDGRPDSKGGQGGEDGGLGRENNAEGNSSSKHMVKTEGNSQRDNGEAGLGKSATSGPIKGKAEEKGGGEKSDGGKNKRKLKNKSRGLNNSLGGRGKDNTEEENPKRG